ncbi:MAG: hypothetical protein E6J55_05655 [Deltaproteobacteria bacterium]|nr:MAG: hypothetical protein E6J55_05655 [Deltaproteobacteria bacterium]
MITDAARVTTPPPPARSLIEKRRTGPRLLRLAGKEPTATEVPPERGPKILLYSQDVLGLGSIWRTLLVSEALKHTLPGAAIVIVTGSPSLHSLHLPDGVDHIGLPWIDRPAGDSQGSGVSLLWYPEVKRMRRAILRAATFGFDPDLIIVDQRPAGAEGELLGTLAALRKRRRRPRVVLGLKDIPMSPTRARRSPLPFQTIEHYYDEVWVYGAPAVFDTVREHAFPAAVARKTIFCGYFDALPADDPPPAAPGSGQAPETRVDGAGPHVLVLPGWGVDGSRLIEAYLRGLLQLPRGCALRTTVVLGAMMPADRRRALLERFGRLPDVSFLDVMPPIERRYAEADLVVSTAGYDRVCELLSFGQRAVLVPRTHERGDELVRARRFAELGYFDLVEPDDLDSGRLIPRVLRALGCHAGAAPPVDLGGLARIVERVRLLSGGAVASPAGTAQ